MFMKILFVSLLVAAMACPAFAQDAVEVPQTEQQEQLADEDGKSSKKGKKKEKKPSKFGNFMRRLGESATGINMSNELFISVDPKARLYADILLIECTGDPQTGNVVLTLGVKAKQNGVTTTLGKKGGGQDAVQAFDAKGNTFECSILSDCSRVDCPAGVPVQFKYAFQNVPASLPVIECVTMDYRISGEDGFVGTGDGGPMQIRNIPIAWVAQGM